MALEKMLIGVVVERRVQWIARVEVLARLRFWTPSGNEGSFDVEPIRNGTYLLG